MNAIGWNMHSVVETVPQTKEELEVTKALHIVEKYTLAWMGHDSDELEMLKNISSIAKAQLSHMKDLGNKLKFIAIPFAYLNPQSYQDETPEVQFTIGRFVDVVSPMFNPYVLCPLEYYSLERHMATREDLPKMVPTEFVPIFQMLDLCLPVLRGIRSDIDDLRRKLEMNIRARQERERLRLRDPLMFAVPKFTDMCGDELVLIGPAWGPDLEEALLLEFGLRAKPKQRALIEESIRRILDQGVAHAALPKAPREIDLKLLNRIIAKEDPEVGARVKRFLEGDHTALTALGVEESARIARLCTKYLENEYRR
ncbi:MAG: hypothetical protein WCT54_01875 [Patescibacteria group bacterium]